jgi:hypothetical protein
VGLTMAQGDAIGSYEAKAKDALPFLAQATVAA